MGEWGVLSSGEGKKRQGSQIFFFRAPVTVTPQPLLIRNPKTFLLLAKSIKNVHTFGAAMMMRAKKEWKEREDFLLYALKRQTGDNWTSQEFGCMEDSNSDRIRCAAEGLQQKTIVLHRGLNEAKMHYREEFASPLG